MKRKETTEIISVMKPAEIGLTQTEAEERLAAGLGNSTKRTGANPTLPFLSATYSHFSICSGLP